MSEVDSPFKVIRGGQSELLKPTKTRLVKLDRTQEIRDRMFLRFAADRDRAIDRYNAKQSKNI